MDNTIVMNIFYDFCIMSVVFFIAKIIRIKFKVMQRMYVPSAFIAGFLCLFFGKQFLGLLPFSDAIDSYSGILIAVVFATMFLGNKGKCSFKTMLNQAGNSFFVNYFAEVSQFGIFILLGVLVLPIFFKGINQAFGLLVPAGFFGGHGSAIAIGTALLESGWDEAVSVGQTFATIGLLCGIVLGVIYINIGTKKKYTKFIDHASEIPDELLSGLVHEDNREPLGHETISSMSLDSLSWHFSLVLVAVGSAYLLNFGLKKVLPGISFPVYGLALICSVVLQKLLEMMKLNSYIDKQTITHIGGSATDYLIAFGIASIDIGVVLKYWLPILLLSLLALIWVSFVLFAVSRSFFDSYWFERGIYVFGMSTGVMATGVILLRIVDPNYKSGILEDFGLAWIFLSFIDMIIVSLSPVFIVEGYGILWGMICIITALISLYLSKHLSTQHN